MPSSSLSSDRNKNLLSKVLLRFGSGFIIVGAIIFLPAGTFRFFNGWLFLGGLFFPMLFALIYFSRKDPELLEKRIRTKEPEKMQKLLVLFSVPVYFIAYMLPGFDFRNNWSQVPDWLVALAFLIMLGSYVMILFVMKQNSYLSRVVELQDDHKLIDTGLYSVVRHPMYLGSSLLYLSSALVLGSYYTLIPIMLLVLMFVFRINNEEKVLSKGLPGYEDYQKRVRYRLFPYIW